jgi:hypothetical protein
MIEDKMVRSGFLEHKILTYGLKAFFVFSKKKNSEDTIMPLWGNMHVLRGFFILFFY